MKNFAPKIYIPDFEPIGHKYSTPDTGIELDSVTQILKNELNSFNWGNNNNAMSRGSNVDLATQLHDEGDLDEKSLSPEIVPYLEQYKIALKDYKIEVFHNQLMRYHPKYYYAGTLDKIVKVNGEMAVIDLKTGHDYAQYKWQVAAYAEMVKHEFGKLKRYSLRLNPDKYVFKEYTDKRDFQEFSALLAAFNIKKNNGYLKEVRR